MGGRDQRSGLALFGIFTASDQNTAKFKHYYEAGAASRGVFPGRELDILSFGWVRTDINPRFQFQLASAGKPIQTSEQLVELTYTIQVLPSLQFRASRQIQSLVPIAQPRQFGLSGALRVEWKPAGLRGELIE